MFEKFHYVATNNMNDMFEFENNPDFNLSHLIDADDTIFTNCQYLDLCSCEKLDFGFSNIKIGHINVHSIPNKYEDIKDLLDAMQEKNLLPDILLLCETFFNCRNYDKFHFQNYDIISEYRKDKSKGGVSIMVRSNLKYNVRQDLTVFRECKFESVFIEICRKNKTNIIVGEIYRVPGTNEADFINDYESIITKIKQEQKRIIIGTDQNLDYLKVNLHNNTMKFFELNLMNRLLPSITKPTRITHRSATLIDNIYIDAEITTNVNSYIATTDISDHFLCIAIIQEDSLQTEKISYRSRKLNETVLRNIKGMLLNKDWSYLEPLSVDEGSREIFDQITLAMNWYAPVRQFTLNSKYKRREPWFTVGLQTSSCKCRKMYKDVVHKPRDCNDYVLYREYRNQYNKLRRIAKTNYYNDLIVRNRNDSKKTMECFT